MSKENQFEEMAKIINKRCVEILKEAGVSNNECPFPYGCNECTARQLYDAGYRKQEWISVEERLPDLQHEVITYSECNGVRLACLVVAKYKNKVWYLYETNKLSIEVTHWMRLPEAPKGGADQ